MTICRSVDEVLGVRHLFESIQPHNPTPVMIDVGACKGSSFRDFAKRNWTIHAFEPNPPLFEELVEKFDANNVVLNQLAVSNEIVDEIPFYCSEESIGISSLKPFRPTHKVTAHVNTITLNSYLAAHDVNQIDFLKIDTEGFELMVLQGLDLIRHPVNVILCEFEDRKTKRLGYCVQDLADYMISFGYTVYVSEWYPIVRYGTSHRWRTLKHYPCALENEDAWGNLMAFKSDPGYGMVAQALNKSACKNKESNVVRKISKSIRAAKRAVERPMERTVKIAIRQVFRNA